ncbi:unnamed protein product [Cyclocybe aegerita]|uniref:Uncharacterized protein n=1 Tax=Cyclocybe aegerita TaxID=1973307 RepID=A0A8S0W9G9_CYCAE|nr:unnamed protein product [Cyclocybe aegerita]
MAANASDKAFIEILVSIAAVIDKHMRSPTMLLDDLETASTPSPYMTTKQKLLDAVANLLPRHPKERIALAIRTDRLQIFITSSDDTCDQCELNTYLLGLWVILKHVAQFHYVFLFHLRDWQQQLKNAGDTENKIVDEKSDKRTAQFAKEGRDLYAKLGELVYTRCRGRLVHKIKRRWNNFQSCLSFLRTKVSDMGVAHRATVLQIIDDLAKYLSTILDGKTIQDATGHTLSLYTMIAHIYLWQKKADFKELVIPLSVEYRNTSGFDLQDLLRGIAPPVDSSEAVRTLEVLAQEENEAGSAALALAGGRNLGIECPPNSASAFQHWEYSNTHFEDGFNDNVGPSPAAPSTVPSLDSQSFKKDDIKIVYHPSTGKAPDIFSFIDYCRMESTMEPRDLDPSLDKQPWRPFATRLNFEFAEVFLDSHMNQRQIDTLISLVHQSKADGSVFTLIGVTDLTKIWDKFAKRTFKVEYKGEELEYDIWSSSSSSMENTLNISLTSPGPRMLGGIIKKQSPQQQNHSA